MESIITLITKSIEFFGTKIIDAPDLMALMIRFLFNTAIIFVIIRLLYYPVTRRKDYLFTFFMIGVIIFLLCFFHSLY